MNEAHQRFQDWLTAGADGDPPRDVAVHASLCAGCRRSIAALDLLAIVNPGLASMPAEPTGREHSRLAMAVRLVGATAILFSAAILGVGVSQLIGVSHTNGPVAQASPAPEQSVLGATATLQASPEPTPTPEPTPRETLTPLGTPVPTHPHPAVTPTPVRTPPPTPIPTPVPTVSTAPTPAPTAPSAPQSPNAFAPTADTVEVSWQESPPSEGVVNYNVYRSTVPGGGKVLVQAGVVGPYFQDTGLTASTTYYYVVTAVNGFGLESVPSAEVSVTTPA